jgi:hypothetical protein
MADDLAGAPVVAPHEHDDVNDRRLDVHSARLSRLDEQLPPAEVSAPQREPAPELDSARLSAEVTGRPAPFAARAPVPGTGAARTWAALTGRVPR